MPGIAAALPMLLSDSDGDGSIAVDRGQRQQLAAVLRTAPIEAALSGLPTVVDASMRDLLAGLDLTEVVVPDGSTDDVDTWDDAARLGATTAPNTASLTTGSTT